MHFYLDERVERAKTFNGAYGQNSAFFVCTHFLSEKASQYFCGHQKSKADREQSFSDQFVEQLLQEEMSKLRKFRI